MKCNIFGVGNLVRHQAASLQDNIQLLPQLALEHPQPYLRQKNIQENPEW